MKKRFICTILSFLCIASLIPFNGFISQAADYYSCRTLLPESISDFEPWWLGAHIKGLVYNNNDTFDGHIVKSIKVSPDCEKSYLVDGNGDLFEDYYEFNLFNYGAETDTNGNPVSLYNARYITYEYYYETSHDTYVGSPIVFRLQNYIDIAENSTINPSIQVNADKTLVANSWQTVTFELDPDNSDLFSYENCDKYQLAQWKLWPMGISTKPVLTSGDAFYIKSIKFYSYDPAESEKEYTVKIFSDSSMSNTVYSSVAEGESFKLYDSFVLPEPDISYAPEGKYFLQYVEAESGNTYHPGDSIVFNTKNTDLNIYAEYSGPVTVYMSPDGAIDGITEPVYTSLADADQAIFKTTKSGTILVSGNAELYDGFSFKSSEITISSFDRDPDSASVVFNSQPEGHVMPKIYGAPTKLVIDDITVKRGDALVADEMFVHLSDIDLTFGKGCLYESGTRESDSKTLNLYFGQHATDSGSNSITFNSKNLRTEILSVNGSYSGATTHSGKYIYNLNAGSFSEVYAVSRDSFPGSCDTISGDVEINVNGGSIKKLGVGSHRNAVLNGSATVTISGAEIDTVHFGPDIADTSATSYYKNIALVLNLKDILTGEYTIPEIVDTGNDFGYENTVYIVNNTEYDGYGSLDTKYQIYVKEGKATPVFNGNSVTFDITSDNSNKLYPYANEAPLSKVNGTYSLPEGIVEVEFHSTDQKLNVAYQSDAETVYKSYYPGETITISDVFSQSEGMILQGYEYGGKFFDLGDTLIMPEENIVLSAVHVDKNSVFYISANGSDANKGNSPSSPFATFEKFYQTIGDISSVIVVMDRVTDWPYTSYTSRTENEIRLADGQTVTITGKDPISGYIYTDAAICRGDDRPFLYSGNLVLSHIKDLNHISNVINTPISVGGNAQLTLDEGYTYSSTTSARGTQVKIMSIGRTSSPTINIDGAMQVFQLVDWENSSAQTVTLNIGPNAVLYGNINVGGDSGHSSTNGTAKTSVDKMFINIDRTQSDKSIVLGGDIGADVKINDGIQILLKDTNVGYTRAEYGDNSDCAYLAEREYIISATQLAQDCDVTSTKLGRVNITIPEGYKAIISTGGKTESLLSSCEYTVSEGITTIAFSKALINDIAWSIDEFGILYISGDGQMPVCTETSSPWYSHRDVINQVIIYPGITSISSNAFTGCPQLTDITVPSSVTQMGNSIFDESADVKIHCYSDSVAMEYAEENSYRYCVIPDRTVYVKQGASFGNGTVVLPYSSIKDAITSFDGESGTIYIIGKYDITSFTCPAWDNMITVSGTGESSYLYLEQSKSAVFNGDITFKNINLDIKDYSHFDSQGATLVMDPGENTTFDSFIHIGPYGNTIVDRADYVHKSGYAQSLFMAGAYATTYSAGIWEDANITIDGGQIDSLLLCTDKYMDGQTGVSVGGNVNVVVNGGTLGEIGYFAQTEPDIMGALNIIFNNGAYATSYINYPTNVCEGVYIIKCTEGGSVLPTDSAGVFEIKANDGLVAMINDTPYPNGKNVLPVGIADISWVEGEQPEIDTPESDNTVAFGKCGDSISWSLDKQGLLEIIGTGEMDDWYLDNQPWYEYAGEIKEVNISEGITSIGNHAFRYFTALEKVSLPNTLTDIGDEAFTVCFSLESIILPNNLESIGVGSFYECTSLKEVVIPESVTSIGAGAFYECISLESVIIPESVTRIGNNAFFNAINLDTVVIAGEDTLIGENAFSGCDKLTIAGHKDSTAQSYADSQNVSFVPVGKVYQCDKVNNLIWLLDEDGLLSIIGSGEIPDYEPSAAPWADHATVITKINLSDGITAIGSNAFYNLISLSEINIPDSVSKIGNSVFFGCSSLQHVDIPDGVTSVGKYTFNGCSLLSEITIPYSVTIIDAYAFGRCSSLKEIKIPSSVTEIGAYSFQYCSALTTAIIPPSVLSIGAFALDGCQALTVRGASQSYAAQYCNSNNIAFASFDGCRVTFDPIQGTVDVSEKSINYGSSYGTLPVPVCAGYTFEGWYTEQDGGRLVTSDTLVDDCNDHTLYARWKAMTAVSLESVRCSAGDTVTMSVSVAHNPGIAGMMLSLSYPEVLSLESINRGPALSGLVFTQPDDLSSSPLVLVWDGEADDTTEGVILELTFTVDKNAEDGDYSVRLSYNGGDIHDEQLVDIPVTLSNATVTVSSHTPGDVNDDGVVNTLDITFIRRYLAGGYNISINAAAADVTGDGNINTLDITFIRRYLAGGYNVTLK